MVTDVGRAGKHLKHELIHLDPNYMVFITFNISQFVRKSIREKYVLGFEFQNYIRFVIGFVRAGKNFDLQNLYRILIHYRESFIRFQISQFI